MKLFIAVYGYSTLVTFSSVQSNVTVIVILTRATGPYFIRQTSFAISQRCSTARTGGRVSGLH